MGHFETGYARTMKVAGLLGRLRRAPASLMQLPASQRSLSDAVASTREARGTAEQVIRDWKKKPDYALEESDVSRYLKRLEQATAENVPGDPRVATRDSLQAYQNVRDRVEPLARLRRNEQLKDVGAAGAAVAVPAGIGYGAYSAPNREE